MNENEKAITAVLSKYEAALNASDAKAVMPLYAEDAAFTPPYSQSAIGAAAVRRAYDTMFKAMTLNVTFRIAEVIELAPRWVFARTHATRSKTDHTTGAIRDEATQDLFLFRRCDDGTWKIACHSFSSSSP